MGQPVPGLRVSAFPCAVGCELFEPGAQVIPLVSWGECVTGEGGRFLIEGLERGVYALAPRAEGIQLHEPRESPDPRKNVTQDRHVRSGRQDARLVVEGVRAFRVKLVVGPDRVPATGLPTRIGVRRVGVSAPSAEARDPMDEHLLYCEEGWVRAQAPQGLPGVWTGSCRIAELRAVPDHAEVFIQAPGCQPARAQVRLRMPGDLMRDALADEIGLEPDALLWRTGTLTVRTQLSEASTGFWTAAPVIGLSGDGSAAGSFLGMRRQDGAWEFQGLPEGEWDAVAHDGSATSRPFRVRIVGGEVRELELELMQRSGAAIAFVDEAGRRVFDVQTCVIYSTTGGDSHAAFRVHASLLQPRFDGVGLLDSLVPLEPGLYRCEAVKSGYLGRPAEFAVKDGEVARVIVALSKNEAYLVR